MKVYTLNNLFLFGGTTKENYPYLVIGKKLRAETRYFANLKKRLDSFSVPLVCSPKILDSIVATMLSEAVPRPFIVGCTIRIPGIVDSTGGVLGNPSLEEKSSEGKIEELGRDWKILTYPGGPGLAWVKGDFNPAVKSKDLHGKELLLDIASQASDSGVESFLALTDGTGNCASGSAIIQYKKEYIVWTLDEVSYRKRG